MQYASGAVARAGEWFRDGVEALRGAAAWSVDELKQVIDLPRWRAATTWSERLTAVSWTRVGGIAGVTAVIALAIVAYAVTRPDPYKPSLPTAHEIALRQQAIENAPHAPPPGLIEANKAVESAR